jgi:hypothetical protein
MGERRLALGWLTRTELQADCGASLLKDPS